MPTPALSGSGSKGSAQGSLSVLHPYEKKTIVMRFSFLCHLLMRYFSIMINKVIEI